MQTHVRAFVVLQETTANQYFRLRPGDIRHESGSGHSLQQSFGKYEVERSAERLIGFFAKKGYWGSFTYSELLEFYRSRGWSTNAPFFGLMGAWLNDGGMMSWDEPKEVYIACTGDGVYFVTDRFVERCAKANDAKELAQAGRNVFETVKNMVNRSGNDSAPPA